MSFQTNPNSPYLIHKDNQLDINIIDYKLVTPFITLPHDSLEPHDENEDSQDTDSILDKTITISEEFSPFGQIFPFQFEPATAATTTTESFRFSRQSNKVEGEKEGEEGENKIHPLMKEGRIRLDFESELKEEKSGFENFQYVRIGNKNQLLGQGAFGEVFLIINKNEKKKYAIKIMNKAKLYENNTKLSIIRNEIEIHKRLDHPYITSLVNFKETQSDFQIILEYAKNGSLYSKIKKMKGGFSEESAFKFFIQTASALYFLQQNKLVHRDLKPENLLLDDDNNIKLSDFGWCDFFNMEKELKQTCGTYEYMAPEIILQRGYNEKVDNWALGILLYELLHGVPPFHVQDLYKDKKKVKILFEKILKNSYEIKEGVSSDGKDLIRRKCYICLYAYLYVCFYIMIMLI